MADIKVQLVIEWHDDEGKQVRAVTRTRKGALSAITEIEPAAVENPPGYWGDPETDWLSYSIEEHALRP